MHTTTRAILGILADLDEDTLYSCYGIGRDCDAPLDRALFAWRDAESPDAKPPTSPPPEPCAYIAPEGGRCGAEAPFGGFCAAHDTLIFEAGGDNSPRGSEIIRRSALSTASTTTPDPR